MEFFEGRSGESKPKIPFNILAASPRTPFRFFEGKGFLGLPARGIERGPRRSPMRMQKYRITTRAARGRSIASRHEIGSSRVE